MIRNPEIWKRFEEEVQKRIPTDFESNLRLLKNMIKNARDLGVWPPENPLEGIEVDIRIARILNTYESSKKAC